MNPSNENYETKGAGVSHRQGQHRHEGRHGDDGGGYARFLADGMPFGLAVMQTAWGRGPSW